MQRNRSAVSGFNMLHKLETGNVTQRVDVPEMESVAKQAFVLNDEANQLAQEIRTDPESFKTPFRVELAKVDETMATDDTLRSGLAQHRMENLFNALKEPTYSALANKLIV